MSNDYFTEVSYTGWLTRIVNSIGGILFGLVLTVAAGVLLFWNEGRAIQTARRLAEGAGVVTSIAADAIDPANEGKLVHLTADALTDEVLADRSYGISINAVRLSRSVKMYQWKETVSEHEEKSLGGGTINVKTYSYNKE